MLKKSLAYSLSLIILTTSVGVNLYTHFCHVFEVSEISFDVPDKCCNPFGNTEESVDFNCCSIDHHYFVLDVDKELTTLTFNIDIFDVPSIIAVQNNEVIKEIQFKNTLRDKSPPGKYNRSLHQFIQVFRI